MQIPTLVRRFTLIFLRCLFARDLPFTFYDFDTVAFLIISKGVPILVRGSMPPLTPCRLRQRKCWKFDYEMVHSQLDQTVITRITSPHPTPIQKTALFCIFSLFHQFFQGGSSDPICPYMRMPMIISAVVTHRRLMAISKDNLQWCTVTWPCDVCVRYLQYRTVRYLQYRTVDRRHVQHSIMVNVTWQRFDQSAKQLIAGHTKVMTDCLTEVDGPCQSSSWSTLSRSCASWNACSSLTRLLWSDIHS